MRTYFISDLHLTPERPHIITSFYDFLNQQATTADALYILGDLFEFWIGDDAASLLGAEPVMQAMRRISTQIPCFFIAGNRDFLVSEQFSKSTGFTILADETVVNLYGEPTLILHGDSLCTDDLEHQTFRQAMTTNQTWKTQFLSLSIEQRIKQAKLARLQSQQHKQQVSMEIMDVNESAVTHAFKTHQVTQMIHGHTHRQNTHHYHINGSSMTRFVLGDWDKTNSVLSIGEQGTSIDNQAIAC